jgi:hypothetical protein
MFQRSHKALVGLRPVFFGPPTPDFPLRLVALLNFMRLSLMKAAYGPCPVLRSRNPDTLGRTWGNRPLLGPLRWSPTGYNAHHCFMVEHFAGITLANAFFDERAVIFVK